MRLSPLLLQETVVLRMETQNRRAPDESPQRPEDGWELYLGMEDEVANALIHLRGNWNVRPFLHQLAPILVRFRP